MERLGGRFALVREVGSGGMARVFLGRDEVLERLVAIKVLKPGYGGADIAARFRREGRTAAGLSHPNIIQIYDAGEAETDEGMVSYIVMEYLTGGDLKNLVDWRGALPGEELCRLGEGVCAGLAHAHRRGVIHRDIKPHNILLAGDGRPKLTDFGVARALEATALTRTGSFLGTVLYSPPEQLKGEDITPQSDVYSLGATLYQAATGEPPFSGAPMEVAQLHITRTPPPLRSRNAEAPPDLETLVMACLAKNPADRPTAEEVRTRLAAIGRPERGAYRASGPGSARRANEVPSPRARGGPVAFRERRTRRVVAGLAVAGLLALSGAVIAPAIFDQGARRVLAPQEGGEQSGEPLVPQKQPARQPPAQGGTDRAQTEDAPSQQNGELTEQAAAEVVRRVYAMAADGRYRASYGLLSQKFQRRQAPTQRSWSGQFSTLERLEFVEEPSVEISAGTATVKGTTEAVHADHTERNTVTWILVNENGEWKLHGVRIREQEII